jgi:hypothetical protein
MKFSKSFDEKVLPTYTAVRLGIQTSSNNICSDSESLKGPGIWTRIRAVKIWENAQCHNIYK